MTAMRNSSSSSSSPSNTDRVNELTEQARAKLEARLARLQDTPLPLAPPLHTAEEEEFNARLERCIAKTDELLIEARAYLRRPANIPKQQQHGFRPAEKHAKRMSTGLQLCEVTTKRAYTDADYAADSAKGLLMMHTTRPTPQLSSPKGTRASEEKASLSSHGVSEEGDAEDMAVDRGS